MAPEPFCTKAVGLVTGVYCGGFHMPTTPIKVTLPKQAKGRPQPTEIEIPEDDIVAYEAMIAADLGIISGPLVNHQANTE